MIEAPRYQGTTINEPATLSGRAGQAWRIRMAPLGARGKPDFDGTLGAWLVCAPHAHPFWSFFVVSAIHLRAIAGVKPATLRADGMTHELLIVALNPEQPLPSLDCGEGWKAHFLTPVDVSEQFVAIDDAIANEILELAILAIVNGQLSPDQDYRSAWHEALADTAAHFASGLHDVSRQ